MPTNHHDAREFDLGAFGRRIEAAAKLAFEELVRSHPDETFVSFALYSDDMGQTVCPSANTAAFLAQKVAEDPESASYFEFGPAEWAFEGRGAGDQFAALCVELTAHVSSIEDDDLAEEFVESLWEASIAALERLRYEGFFERVAKSPISLVFQGSPGDVTIERERAIVARLNPPDIVERHRQWTESWGAQ